MSVFFTRRGAPPSLGTKLGDLEIGTIVHIKENGGVSGLPCGASGTSVQYVRFELQRRLVAAQRRLHHESLGQLEQRLQELRHPLLPERNLPEPVR